MLDFTWPWVFYFLPLPILVRYLLPRAKSYQASLRVPRLDYYALAQSSQTFRYLSIGKLLLIILAWLALLCAAAQPKWVSEPISLPVSGRDLMLAIDLSGSMEEKDFVYNRTRINRLTASKIVVADFISKRKGDRLGLIVFGEQAYLQTPLTFDTATVAQLMEETFIGLAGKKATAIGDAIGIAIKRLTDNQANKDSDRILILVTDGANNAGAITPEKAAEIAATNQLKIYTIGIGADEEIVKTWFGQQIRNPSKDLNEDALKLIANKTGGRYFRARNTQELQQIYNLIDQLEPVEKEQETFKPVKSLFYWPLGLSVLLTMLIALLLVIERGFSINTNNKGALS